MQSFLPTDPRSPPNLPASSTEYRALWGNDLLLLYLSVLKTCTNPVSIEASAGAIQNLTACDWLVSNAGLLHWWKPVPVLCSLGLLLVTTTLLPVTGWWVLQAWVHWGFCWCYAEANSLSLVGEYCRPASIEASAGAMQNLITCRWLVSTAGLHPLRLLLVLCRTW